jgi:hypothetical protein
MDVGDSRLARISVDATQAGVVINTANAQIASLTDPVASNDSDSASVTIAPPPNSPPVADAQSITVEARVSTSILLTGSDPDNDALTFAIKSGPVNGELSGTQPNMVYLSDSGFVGSDAFTFVSNDGEFDSAAATVSINVVDTTPPSLSVPDDLIVEATATRTPLDIGAASASDTVDGLLVPTSDAPTNGFPLGETTVVWTVADSSGNEASATQSVRVIDTTPPVLTVPGDITHDASAPLTNVDIGQATAADIFPVTLSNDAPADGYPVGTTVVTWTAVDTSGNVSVAVQNVTMTNDPPALDPIADTTIDEGDTLSVTASFSDADSVSWTATADYGDGGGPEALAVDTVALTMALIHTYADNGSYPVTVSITDAEGDTDTTSFSVTVNNVAPVLSNLTVAPALAELGNHTVSASVDFVDPGVLDTHTVTINWGDGSIESATVTEANGSGSASATHQYAATGVYTVTMSVTDKDGATSTAVFQFVVIYDPSGGFVTGGGWIDSPLGACQLLPACMTMTGKATFGFVSKYKKGATTPTGKTEFQFQAGDLNFHSSSYDWLVIAGAKAMYKGIGTINGVGNYGFMLSAIDANLTPSTDVDLFRIKIWDKDSGDFVVYDNQLADAEDADPTTAIGGGSIKIHKAKK